MTNDTRAPVTVIGLGMMGSALAATFQKAGHPTTVWNRSDGKTDALVEQGAARAESVREAVAASRLTVVCVSDYGVVRELLAPLANALAGRTLVNLTSGTPEQARALAAWAAEHGADYLDGAIMAVPPQIGGAETLLLYGGPPAVFETHHATLSVLGGRTTHLGSDPGLAALYDVALLGIMYATLGGYFHALALVGSVDIRATTFVPYAMTSLTDVVSYLPDLAREVDERDYVTEISTLDINKAGIAHVVATSAAQGIPADVLTPMQALIDRRVAEGHGRHGLASLVETLRRPA